MLASVFMSVALVWPAAEPLTVRPMATPKPALRYQLLPEVRELNPGNPVQWYLRCFAEQRNFFFGIQGVEERARYREMSLAELAKEDLRNYGGSALTQADWGARLETADWEVLRKVQDGSEQRVAELGAFKVLAIALQVRFRGAIARADWDGAIRTAKTMFGFARHLGESPSLAANLLGLEVAGLALDSLEEMIQQPAAPNLYWALADLPAPLVELRKGLQGERAGTDAELGVLRADTAMSDEQLEEFVGKLSGRIGAVREQAGRPPKNIRAAIQAKVEDRERAGRIRARLLKNAPANGFMEKFEALTILSLSPLQLILLDERDDFENRRDEYLKLLRLAPWQIDAVMKDDTNRGDGLFSDFFPNFIAHRRSQARIEQRIAMLRCIEAIRNHGGLPENLSELKVPLPEDPFTGKPFEWSVNSGVAKLSGAGKTLHIALTK
jgi:hypothetical protein